MPHKVFMVFNAQGRAGKRQNDLDAQDKEGVWLDLCYSDMSSVLADLQCGNRCYKQHYQCAAMCISHVTVHSLLSSHGAWGGKMHLSFHVTTDHALSSYLDTVRLCLDQNCTASSDQDLAAAPQVLTHPMIKTVLPRKLGFTRNSHFSNQR